MMSPHDLLPIEEPRNYAPSRSYFYLNVVKPLLADVLRIQLNGIPIDMSKVKELQATVDSVLASVAKRLASNPIIQRYLDEYNKRVLADYREDREAKLRTSKYYYKEFKSTNMEHRTAAINHFIKLNPDIPEEPQDKWSIKNIKKSSLIKYDDIQRIVNRDETVASASFVKQAMRNLAQIKTAAYNKKYLDQIKNPPSTLFEPFNPGSTKQKQELFEMLGIESTEQSKDTGKDSWGKQAISDLKAVTTDPVLLDILEAFQDFSGAAIIRNNFISAFDKFVIDGRIQGNFKLFGAKSFRLTSNNPNLLNLPSTGSVYAKPLKKCLIAPDGWVVLTADYNALEDRVLASITKDPGKVAIQLDLDLDGHCYNALGYFKAAVEQHIGSDGTHNEKTKRFNEAINAGNKELKAIRQASKPVTFGIALTTSLAA